MAIANQQPVLTLRMVCVLSVFAFGLATARAQMQITLGASSQNVVFMSTSSSSVDIAFGSCSSTTFTGTCTLFGSAVFDPGDSGSYTFTTTTTSSYTASNAAGSTYPITTPAGATSTFSYTSTDGDSLSGTISWMFVSGGAKTATLEGTMKISSSAGDAPFLSTFPAGSTVAVDFTTQTLSCNPSISPCNLAGLFANPGTTASAIGVGSGEVAPLPEPGSLLLCGSGVLAVGSWLRRRRLPA